MVFVALLNCEQNAQECDPEFRHFVPRRGRRNWADQGTVAGYQNVWRILRFYQCSHLFACYHPAQIAFFIHIENNNREIIFLAKSECGHIHHFKIL